MATDVRADTSRPALAEQFDDLEQQHRAATFGMWVFLITEVMLFGGMFTAYAWYRFLYAEGFAEGSRHMDLLIGGINTGVLIVSSLTMALAIHAVQEGQRRALLGFLGATIVLGSLFLGLKAVEYWRHWNEALVPGLRFSFEGVLAGQVQLFFLFYFIMTG